MNDAPGALPTTGSLPDEEIVRRVQRGERKWFAVLFERHYARLERYCRHLGVPEVEMEDVLADAFARAYDRIDRFDPDSGSRYLSYLYAIVRNLATDRARERGRQPERAPLEAARSVAAREGEHPLDRLVRQEEVRRIRQAMARLSPGDREIITLSYDRELSCREIMAIMGKPSISAVTTHLYKALRRLRALVVAEMEPEVGSRREEIGSRREPEAGGGSRK